MLFAEVRYLIPILFASIIVGPVVASTAQAKLRPKKRWSLSSHLGYSVSAIKTDSVQDVSSTNLGLSASLKLRKVTLGLGFQAQRDNFKRSRQEVSQGDAHVSAEFSRSRFAHNYLYYKPMIVLGLPMSKSSREDSLMSAISLVNSVSLNTKKLRTPKWSVDKSVTISQRFYEYYESAAGTPNIKYVLSNSFKIGYSFLKSFSLGANFNYRVTQKFSGLRTAGFSISESIIYKLTSNVNASLTHSNGGMAYRPNHKDSNIRLFDEFSSIYYLSLSWGY